MASGYDVTIKLYQNHVIERVTHAVDAINVLDVFCSCYSVIPAVSQTYFSCFTICKQFMLHVNNLSATPHHTTLKSLASQLQICFCYSMPL